MRKTFFRLVLFSLLFICFKLILRSQEQNMVNPCVYKGEKRVTIVSYSKWVSKERLKEVYDELINNFHGEEIKYLSYIYIILILLKEL